METQRAEAMETWTEAAKEKTSEMVEMATPRAVAMGSQMEAAMETRTVVAMGSWTEAAVETRRAVAMETWTVVAKEKTSEKVEMVTPRAAAMGS